MDVKKPEETPLQWTVPRTERTFCWVWGRLMDVPLIVVLTFTIFDAACRWLLQDVPVGGDGVWSGGLMGLHGFLHSARVQALTAHLSLLNPLSHFPVGGYFSFIFGIRYLPLPVAKIRSVDRGAWLNRTSLYNRFRGWLYLRHLREVLRSNGVDMDDYMGRKAMDDPYQYPLMTHDAFDVMRKTALWFDHWKDKTYIGLNAQLRDLEELSPEDVVFAHDKYLGMHTFVAGPTGTGKSQEILSFVTQFLMKGSSAIIIDGKGSVSDFQQLHALATSAEYGNGSFRSFSMVLDSDTYNILWTSKPQYLGQDRKQGLLSMAEILFNQWVSIDQTGSEYYRNKSRQYYNALVRALIASGQPYCVNDLRVLLENKDFRDHFLETTMDALPMGGAQWKEFREIQITVEGIDKTLPPRQTPMDVTSGLTAFLDQWADQRYNSYSPSFELWNLIEARKQPLLIYVHCPTNFSPAYAKACARIFQGHVRLMSGYIGAFVESSEIRPIVCVVDEAASIGDEGTLDVINKGRSAGLVVVLSTQMPSDLTLIGGPDWAESVRGNCRTKLIFQQTVGENPMESAKLCGTKPLQKKTVKNVEGRFRLSVPTLDASARDANEFYMPPDQFRSLKPQGQAVYIPIEDTKDAVVVNVGLAPRVFEAYTPVVRECESGLGLQQALYDLYDIPKDIVSSPMEGGGLPEIDRDAI